jgi:hypothetical protein
MPVPRSARPAATALLVSVLLLTASCAAKKNDGGAAGTGTTRPGDNGTAAPSTTAKNGTGTTAAHGTPTTVGQGGSGNGTGTTAKQGGSTTTAKQNAQVDPGARSSAGAFARTLLRPTPATRIVVDVMQQSGAAPPDRVLTHAVEVLSQVTGKPISRGAAIALPGGATDHSAAEIRDLADRHGTAQSPTQAVIHLLFLKGTFQGDESVLGIAVRGDTAAVMDDQVRNSASPLASRATIEDAVTEHELGHLLGLVDLVLQTGRGDPEHPGHSTNRNSVMYWAVESDLVSQVLGGPPPVDFDDADRADLATIRRGG